MSETQRQNDYQYTPVTLTNFDVDASGLIFTVAKSSTYEDLEGKVRALNAAGKDVFGKEASAIGNGIARIPTPERSI